ncbi:OLC1v1018651C1 [Oldenlandia corymbosa var. corymbosa]|uniref:non-specific serine/threonine protein kinase n=1 Tax=Oldenlandia corymbosa var. corymbosa TaxID=529605 RepID=A0AAV1EC74_OLDCO|nr:OLC1v1018651C1 [Oldenlandia corymbosa var. corymbosa]
MGQSSKKKKKRGGGGGGGGGRRAPSKDRNSFSEATSEVIAEELTALCAIFQDDCKVISGSPPQVHVKLRPYSKDTGYEESDLSALLLVRFLPGYPNKCPKLQIISETGLSEVDAENLLTLLHDQANSNAREGRVMIYNLVEAAQEFLSEVIPQSQVHDSVISDKSTQSQKEAALSSGMASFSRGPFVHGYIDLFSGCGESWRWSLGIEESTSFSTLVHSNPQDSYKVQNDSLSSKIEQNMRPVAIQGAKPEFARNPSSKLVTLEEESDDDIKSTDSSRTLSSASGTVRTSGVGVKDIFVPQSLSETEDSDQDSESSGSVSSKSEFNDQVSQTMRMDLVLAHLLRLACAPKGPLGDTLPQIASELYDMGILSERVRNMATEPSSLFDKAFNHVFGRYTVSSKICQFWRTVDDFERQNSSSMSSSRYLSDFEELQPLGHGGFGHVVLCKNKIDGRQYAVKKIRLKDKSPPVNDRILREVATLSRLQHQHVVRYYQAWFETGVAGCFGDATQGSKATISSTFSSMDGTSSDLIAPENKLESTYLYIQMEYCPRTLRQMFEFYNHFDKELAWHLFRQIVEGLAHIHAQGIIHRDLTPSNIFFDARNDIKIGDFGLAKFLKLEQVEQEIDATETIGVSVDGTGQVGTYFYTAPEIEQGWPKINEKADMYSLGVVFFELWHPFGTAMERHIILSELKQKGELPSTWVSEFPEQASLLRLLMSSSPSERPSATELLQHAFPPRMENELLDNILRTIHTSEDTGVYDKIVGAIFNEETLTSNEHERVGRSKPVGGDASSLLLTDVNTSYRDQVFEVAVRVFRQHCAKRLENIAMRMLGDFPQFNRNTVKLLTQGGDMIELCHELRLQFVKWVIANQKSFFKRYEVSYVYRRAIGHSPPNRYLQGDFDIVGGAVALTEAEVIKTAMDIIGKFFHPDSCDIHLNHGDLLEAIWSWTGVKPEHRQKVAELLSLLGSLRPQSSERKSKWVVIRRQLQQELNLSEAAVNRLQTVGLRFCGAVDQALARLRGALPADKSTRKALDELSELWKYLRIWKLDGCIFVDALMAPTESYHRNIFFQIYLRKNTGSLIEGTLLAVGGRYDHLLHDIGENEHKANPPGAVGTSIALETILLQYNLGETKFLRNDFGMDILVCSRGGGGLIEERMTLVADLWNENIRAEFVPICDPSLTEQYEYANDNDIKCLVIITDAGVSQTDSVKVRHLELKKEKEVAKDDLVKFLSEAMATQFRNPNIWN